MGYYSNCNVDGIISSFYNSNNAHEILFLITSYRACSKMVAKLVSSSDNLPQVLVHCKEFSFVPVGEGLVF
jgi:hypothetical protein